MASAYLTFRNGTREIPEGKWYQPAVQYVMVKDRERLARVSLEEGMVTGGVVGLLIGLIAVLVSKYVDGTLRF